MAMPAAWYRDPRDPGMVRWWDGAAWTPHVQPIPSPAPPPPSAPPPPTTPVHPDWVAEVGPPPGMGFWNGPEAGQPASSGSGAPRLSLRIALIASVIVVALVGVVAVGARLGGGKSASPGYQVVEGDGYRFEVPDGWTDAGKVGVFDEFIKSPTTATISVVRAPALNVRATEDALVGTMAKELGNASIKRSVSAMAGEEGEHVILTGTAPNAPTLRLEFVIELSMHDGVVVALVLGSDPTVVDSLIGTFDHVVQSFQWG